MLQILRKYKVKNRRLVRRHNKMSFDRAKRLLIAIFSELRFTSTFLKNFLSYIKEFPPKSEYKLYYKL